MDCDIFIILKQNFKTAILIICNEPWGLRVPFVVSCCQFLKNIILKTFNKVVLAFLPVESKTNMLYVNIHFTRNLFFGFGIYCSKAVREPVASHPFWASTRTKNVLSILFSRWRLVNDSRNKRLCAFFYASLVLKQLIFI